MIKNQHAVTIENLVDKIVENATLKGEQYKVWEKGVEIDNPSLPLLNAIEDARTFMFNNEYVGKDELIKNDYLRVKSEDDMTYELGKNKKISFLVEIAYTYTEDCGYITAAENDYYEVAKRQAQITKEYLND